MPYSPRQLAVALAGAILVAGGLLFAYLAMQDDAPRASCGGPIAQAPLRLEDVAVSGRFVAWNEDAPDAVDPGLVVTRVRVHDITTGETRALGGAGASRTPAEMLAGDLLAYRAADGRAVVEDLANRTVAPLPAEATRDGAPVAFDGRWLVLKTASGPWSAWDARTNATQRVPAEGLLADGQYAYWNGGEAVVLDLAAGRTSTVPLPARPSDFDGATLVALDKGRVAYGRVGAPSVETLALPAGWTATAFLRVDGDRVGFAGHSDAGGLRWVVTRLGAPTTLDVFGSPGHAYLGDVAGNRTAYVEEPPIDLADPTAGPSRVTLACLD